MTTSKQRHFTDEQLSRILSTCAGLYDVGFGLYPEKWIDGDEIQGCVNQLAFNEPDPDRAVRLWKEAALAFDALDFCDRSDPERLLSALEREGFA